MITPDHQAAIVRAEKAEAELKSLIEQRDNLLRWIEAQALGIHVDALKAIRGEGI